MVALAGLWRSFGVEPGVVVGHSQGEIAAACVAGGLSLGDGARVVVLRSRLLGRVLAGRGGMVSVALDAERVAGRLVPWGGRLGVAAVNGPSSVVVSGEVGALDEFLGVCEGDGVWARRVAVDYASHSVAVEELREELVGELGGIEPVSCGVPFFSTATGGLLDTARLDGEYWYRSLRERVRFEEAVRALAGDAGVFVEVSPHPVLMGAVGETLEDLGVRERVGVLGSLRRGEGGMERFVHSLAEAWAWGARVDWGALLGGRGARPVDLPAYAFQRERYWLEAPVHAGELHTVGLRGAEHPLLGAAVKLAGEHEQWLFTGRVSIASQPWVADHVLLDTVVVPGTAFVEMAFAAGVEVGCGMVEELTLQAPLVLEGGGVFELQLLVEEGDESGRRAFAIHSCPRGEVGGELGSVEWVCHARGVLAGVVVGVPEEAIELLAAESWPPEGAEPLDVEGFYVRLGAAGFAYGPAFTGIRAAWRRGRELFTEVALAQPHTEEATRFGLHPALFDAALQGGAVVLLEDAGEGAGGRTGIPFSLSSVRCYAGGASSLRVRVTVAEGTLGMVALDERGAPVVSVDSLAFRPVEAQQLTAAGRRAGDCLFGLEWVRAERGSLEGAHRLVALAGLDAPGVAECYADLAALCEAVGAGAPVPDVVLAPLSADWGEGDGEPVGVSGVGDAAGVGGGDLGVQVRGALASTLELLRAWFGDERLAGARLVIVSRGAVAARAGELPAFVGAACLGLVGSAQSEYPGRLLLCDVDGEEASWAALVGALSAGEPRLALRDGQIYVPRLVRASAEQGRSLGEGEVAMLGGEGTVLVTGGTGGLGGHLARHLARVHGARHLLLVGRRGDRAEGAGELVEELRGLGCEVEVVACDVADRERLAGVLAAIPPERPLRGVVHAAGVLDDGVIATLTAEQMERVLAPKVDGALHLDELTRDLELEEFVLFSSFAGVVGSPGQGNYAAANAFLDALAQRRRAEGLAGTSLAWGPWLEAGGMLDGVGAPDRARLQRTGVAAFSAEEGLELFDSARALGRPLVVAVGLKTAALHAQARASSLPALLWDLVPAALRSGGGVGSLLEGRLRELPEADWDGAILALVLEQVAAVRGDVTAGELDPGRSFSELGFDSLAAIDLRNQLAQVTGLRFPATLVFDHPTPSAVGRYVRSLVGERELGGSVARGRARARRRSEEPIAIVGMSCRFPGGVRSAGELWELVAGGRDAIGGFPEDRGWDLERLYDPDPDRPGTCYTREGGFIYDIADFDAGFFGIGPNEALAMDPQQRLLLETAWEVFEDACIDPVSLRGSDTGVFIGASSSSYALSVPGELESFRLTGTLSSVVSGRLAYVYGLEGPAMTVDTACSASLVAMHLACAALRRGECGMALAGGVSVSANPEIYVDFARQRGLAVDGRCKAFADAADGVGFSDGGGLVLLERLSDAERAGRRVLAVVRGSATNQDGASNGLSAPNGPSQERVISAALADAGLGVGDVDVVEGHGTGTTLGDPIEAQALLATYGCEREGDPLWLGSVKSNIGHTGCGAGVAGVIKMVGALRNGLLPATLHVDAPSSHVDWSAGGVRLLTEPVVWPRGERPRRVGVSSFGVSGTNAHLILEEAPASLECGRFAGGGELADGGEVVEGGVGVGSLPVVPWLLSGKGEGALRAQAGRLYGRVQGDAGLGLLDVAHTLASARAQLECRAVVLGGEREQLLEGLRACSRGVPAAGVFEGVVRQGLTAFMFTGQGAQRVGMGSELCEVFPVFRDALNEVCGVLDGYSARPLREVLFADEGSPEAGLLDGTEFAQAGLFAVEVALFRLLESFGVRPDFLIGHSVGELSAACVAGVFSLEDACRLVAARGQLMGALPGDGGMLAVEASEVEVCGELEEFGEGVAVAAVNGPQGVVVSGESGALEELGARWRERGLRTRRLRVSHAFHSPLMEPMLGELREVAVGIEHRPARIPIISNVTGRLLEGDAWDGGEYWVRHARNTVRFADGVATLQEAGVRRFLELGPDGVLSALARECLDRDIEEHALLGAALREGRPEAEALLALLARAHCAGARVDWGALLGGRGARPVDLPAYAFQRERYWLEAPVHAGELHTVGLRGAEHPLLGAAVKLAGEHEQWLFTGRVSIASQPWVAEHVLMDVAVLPGTAYVELALTVGAEIGCETLQELTLEAPLVLGGQDVQLQLQVERAEESGECTFAIHSRVEQESDADGYDEDGGWIRHARGVLAQGGLAIHTPLIERLMEETWPPAEAEPVDVEGMIYDRLSAVGFAYGPAFTCIRAAWRRGEEFFAEVALDERNAEEAVHFGIHPALFDGAVHGVAAGVDETDTASGGGRMLLGWSGVRRYKTGASALRVHLVGDQGTAVSLAALDETGAPVVSVDSLSMRPVDARQLAQLGGHTHDALLRLEWTAPALPGAAQVPARIAVISELDAGLDAPRYRDLAALGEAIETHDAPPEMVIAPLPVNPDGNPAAAAYAQSRWVLELLQGWLADQRLSASRLVLVTRGAVSTTAEEQPDPAGAAIWGMVRSAQSEHPGQFVLVDVDGGEAAWSSLPMLLSSGEPQLALRGQTALIPRLARVSLPSESAAASLDLEGTVLITGGTGGLGAQLARHLAAARGVRHLLLASRRGAQAEGWAELEAELTACGCAVGVASCDVTDRGELERLVESIPEDHPLTAVVHAAGVLDDGLIESLDAARLEMVMRPKVEATLHLHELTRERDIAAFILFSSAAGIVGAPGQGNYASANAFMDAFAQWRRAQGLPAMSLAWGPWAADAGMTQSLSDAERARLRRSGTVPLASAEALELFDMACGVNDPLLALVRVDLAAMRAQARGGEIPAVLAGLVRMHPRGASEAADSLAKRLALVPESAWEETVLDFVREQVSIVLGLASRTMVEPRRAFQEIGFTSLEAIELRNRLTKATGLRLPATMVFDHPSPAAVADYIRGQLDESTAVQSPIDGVLDKLETLLTTMAGDERGRARAQTRLRSFNARLESFLADLGSWDPGTVQEYGDGELTDATDEEIFELIDRGFDSV